MISKEGRGREREKRRKKKKRGRERKERKRASYLVSDNFASFVHSKYAYHDTYLFSYESAVPTTKPIFLPTNQQLCIVAPFEELY